MKTPQDTIQRPRTMYGVTKVTTELLVTITIQNMVWIHARYVFPGNHFERDPFRVAALRTMR